MANFQNVQGLQCPLGTCNLLCKGLVIELDPLSRQTPSSAASFCALCILLALLLLLHFRLGFLRVALRPASFGRSWKLWTPFQRCHMVPGQRLSSLAGAGGSGANTSCPHVPFSRIELEHPAHTQNILWRGGNFKHLKQSSWE